MAYTFPDCEVDHETPLAVLVKFPGGRKVWVPKKVIDDDSEVYDKKDGRKGTLIVEDWFAEKEGLEL